MASSSDTPPHADSDRVAHLERALARAHEECAQLRGVMHHADCLLWHATVSEGPEGQLFWDFRVGRSRLRDRIFEIEGDLATTLLWANFDVPDLPLMRRRAAEAIRSGQSGYAQEFSIRRKRDGAVFYLQEQTNIVPLSATSWRLVGVMIDVTARHEAEQARRRSERRVTALLERLDCLLWHGRISARPDGSFSWELQALPSPMFRRLFGPELDPARWNGWPVERAPDIAEMGERAGAALRAGRSGYTQEFRVLHPGGEYWLRESVSLQAVEPGIWEAVGVVTDLTERRHASLALAVEKERLAVTLAAMQEAVVTLDASGRVEFLNEAAGRLFGLPTGYALGRTFGELGRLVDRELGATLNWPTATVWQEGLRAELPPEAGLSDCAGQLIALEGCAAPLHDPAGHAVGAVVVLRDVSERLALERQLQRASKLESVGLLAGGIAHDFNNLLTAIGGNLSLAQLDLEPTSTAASFLAEALAAVGRAGHLTQQLLTFARGGEPVRSSMQLPELAAEVARFALRGSKVRLELDFPDTLWPAHADKGQISQVLHNLVLNAAQAMPNGGRVHIGAANDFVSNRHPAPLAPGPYLHVTVTDDGPGLPPEHLSRVFDPYFTTKSDGHGLGLATVHSILKRHRGHIDIESQLGVGTTFHFWLPAIAQPASAQPPRANLSASAAPDGFPRFTGRALVMDDELTIRRILQHFLARLGFEPTAVADGAAAVAAFREAHARGEPPQLLFMDLTVPGGVGGREALQQILAIDPTARAIVISGYSADPVMAHHREHGFAGRLAKPFELAELVQVISEVLATSAVTR
jgi:signal transduction histidine kinase/CheY-like chemotaxis protein